MELGEEAFAYAAGAWERLAMLEARVDNIEHTYHGNVDLSWWHDCVAFYRGRLVLGFVQAKDNN